MDIPNFDSLVDNEFANIDQSYKEFRENGIINAYTKGETSIGSDTKALKEFSKATAPRD